MAAGEARREARFLLNFTRELWLLSHAAGHCDAGAAGKLVGGIRLMEGTVQQVIPSEGELGALFAGGEVLKLDALYVGFGARCDRAGYLEVDRHPRSLAAIAINISLNAERWP